MLFSQMALLGFCLNYWVQFSLKPNIWMSIIGLLFPIIGLILVHLFKYVQKITDWYITKWLNAIIEIENNVLRDIKLAREWENPHKPGRTRDMADKVINLFYWTRII